VPHVLDDTMNGAASSGAARPPRARAPAPGAAAARGGARAGRRARAGDEAKMKELVDGGADVNVADEEGRTPLHFACGAAPRPRAPMC